MDNNTPLVSVIMPAYNCAEYIGKSIESILNQTYQNIEFIICDDGSDDDTYQIICDYKERYPDKIVVLKNQHNIKLPATLNKCLEYVHGDYVARMDADDISLPQRLEKQVEFLNAHSDIALVGTSMYISNGERTIGSINITNTIADKYSMKRGTPFCHGTIMTYKTVFDTLGGYSADKSALRVEDLELWYRFFKAGYKGANITERLYVATEDENAMSRRIIKDRLRGVRVMARGYKMLNYPLKSYSYLLIELLKCAVPKSLYIKCHRKKLAKSEQNNCSRRA